MLEVKNLHATIAGKEILKGINLTINDGEIHAIMGPNGSGKSTLSAVLTGNPLYTVTEGEAIFNGKNLLDMKPEDRAREGLFLSFLYPVEIPGVSMTNFMRAAINAKREYQGLEPLNTSEFMKLMREKRELVELDSKLARRSVNEGFSGGEKKRNEIFQMAMLEPKLSILDETDSGLDVDAMRIVADGVNKMHTDKTSAIVITHYERLLDMIKPSVVHVLYKGRIVKTAGPELAKEIEVRGYDWSVCILFTPSATIRIASTSRPESVSSRIESFGSSIAIWKISLRFFSPPEKPSFTERRANLLSSSTNSRFSRISFMNSLVFKGSKP